MITNGEVKKVITDLELTKINNPGQYRGKLDYIAGNLKSEMPEDLTKMKMEEDEARFREAMREQKDLAEKQYAQQDSIRDKENREVVAVVVTDDESRLKGLEGVERPNMTGVGNAARRVSSSLNSRIKYVATVEEAKKEFEREGRTWENTVFFVESNKIAAESDEYSEYSELKQKAFIWNLDIPEGSLCSVTPLGFLNFSLKFNDFLGRVKSGEEDTGMRELAEIMLVNMGEDVTEESIREVIVTTLKPMAQKLAKKFSLEEFLLEFSGKFTWNLPKIAPANWGEVKEYFDSLTEVYRAL
jgi:hypothetical protein